MRIAGGGAQRILVVDVSSPDGKSVAISMPREGDGCGFAARAVRLTTERFERSSRWWRRHDCAAGFLAFVKGPSIHARRERPHLTFLAQTAGRGPGALGWIPTRRGLWISDQKTIEGVGGSEKFEGLTQSVGSKEGRSRDKNDETHEPAVSLDVHRDHWVP
jgi:hypothetical protein